METYILRIYRREKGIPHRIMGIIEESGVEEKRAFTCLDELQRILNCNPAKKITGKKSQDPATKKDHYAKLTVYNLFGEPIEVE